MVIGQPSFRAPQPKLRHLLPLKAIVKLGRCRRRYQMNYLFVVHSQKEDIYGWRKLGRFGNKTFYAMADPKRWTFYEKITSGEVVYCAFGSPQTFRTKTTGRI